MYSVSSAFKDAMLSPAQEHKVIGTIGSVSFDESNIVDGSFQISNQSTNTDDVVLGSCFVGQLTAEFTGINVNFGDWIGKVITPSFALKIGANQWESVPLGIFTIKEANHTAYGVKITAYDNMIKFDKKFDKTHFKSLKGLYNIITRICTDCGVTLGMTQAQIEALPNGNNASMFIYGVDGKPAEYSNDLTTNRDLLFWCAQALGCFATINRSGQLEFRKYNQTVVDEVSNNHRIAGATFADYVTHYIGIYVENLDDRTEDYYGYDVASLNAEIAETQGEISDDQERILELDADLVEWKRKLDNHECTQQEYDEAVAEIDAELTPLKKDVKQLSKRLSWLQKALAQAGDDGADMDLGANPLLMAKNKNTRDQQRRNVLDALSDISYTPFSASVICGCIYDLGDVIQFSGGLYNASNDSFGCVMSYTYTHNGCTELDGFGVDPAIVQIRTKEQKSTDRAEANAIKAKEPVHLEKMDDGSVVVRDDSILRDSSDEAGGESDRVWSFQMWAQNDIIVTGKQVYSVFKVELKTDSNAIICDFPIEIGGRYRTANIGGNNYTDSQVNFVIKVPKDGERPHLWEKNTFIEGNDDQSTNVYVSWDARIQPNWGSWGESKEIAYKAASVGDWDYYVAGRSTGTVYAGMYGMSAPDKHYPSVALFMADLEAGKIDPPQLMNGDVVLPKNSTQKELSDSIQRLANAMSEGSTGDKYNPDTALSEESPIDVESDKGAKSIIRAIDQIKTGVGGFLGSIKNVGRGEVVAEIYDRNDHMIGGINASTNITTIVQDSPSETQIVGAGTGDTCFVLENVDGFTVKPDYMDGMIYEVGSLKVNEDGYQLGTEGTSTGSDIEYGGFIVYMVSGLRAGESYTFTYGVEAYMYESGERVDAVYNDEVQRYGHFGLLYADSYIFDTSVLPSNDDTNHFVSGDDWYWQNFQNIGKTKVYFTNTITATSRIMWFMFILDPIARFPNKKVHIDITDFKSSNTVFEMSELYVNSEYDWFKFKAGSGASDYPDLTNKPSINSVTLLGDKTTRDLGMIEECTQAEYDQKSSDEKNNPDKVFYIKDAGGGGGGGGGGGSYTETELFSGSASTAGNVQLSDDIGNYDEFVIWAGWSASNVNGVIPIRVSVAMFKTFTYVASPQTSTDHIFCYLYSTQYFRVARGSDDTKIYLFDNHSGAIKRVVGIKY